MTKKLNQKGFGFTELLIIVVVLAVVVTAGVIVYKHGKHYSSKDGATTTAQTSPKSTESRNLQTAQHAQQYLVIKEWGVQIPLADTIKDAYYIVDSRSEKNSDGKPSGVFLGLRSLTDKSCEPNYNNEGGIGAIGAILRVPPDYNDPISGRPYTEKYPSGKVIGDYYYAYQSWSSRSSCKDKEVVDSSDMSFAAAVKQVQVSAD